MRDPAVKVMARVRSVGSESTYHRLAQAVTIGPFVMTQDTLGDWALEGAVTANNLALAAIDAHSHLIALGGALSLVTRHPYWTRPARIFFPAAADSQEESPHDGNNPLTTAQIANIQELEPLIAAARRLDPRIDLIFDDIEAAARDQTNFCLVHLQRVLQTIMGEFGSQPLVNQALGLTDEILSYIEKLESDPKHAALVSRRHPAGSDIVAHIQRTAVTTTHIEEAWRNVAVAVRAYLRYVLDRDKNDA